MTHSPLPSGATRRCRGSHVADPHRAAPDPGHRPSRRRLPRLSGLSLRLVSLGPPPPGGGRGVPAAGAHWSWREAGEEAQRRAGFLRPLAGLKGSRRSSGGSGETTGRRRQLLPSASGKTDCAEAGIRASLAERRAGGR